MKYMRHPAADLITQSFVEHDKYLHRMAKMNRMSYEVISKDPDFMFNQYLHYEYMCRTMIDNDSPAPSLNSHSENDYFKKRYYLDLNKKIKNNYGYHEIFIFYIFSVQK